MPPPKNHRVHSTSNLRPHSRSSSSTKLAGNLQINHKDFVQPKGVEKTKKISHEHARTTSPLPRTNSAVRVEAREREHQTAPPSKRQPPLATATTNKSNGSKLKGGFTISVDSEDDDDAWVSSEADTSTESVSLARESDPDSDTENNATPVARESSMPRLTKRTPSTQNTVAKRSGSETGLSRVNTARPPDANGSSKGVAQRNGASRLERTGSQRRVQISKALPTPVTSPLMAGAEPNHHDSRPDGPSTQPSASASQSQLLTPSEPSPKIIENITAKMQLPPTFSPNRSDSHPPYQTNAISNPSYHFATPDEMAKQSQALRHVTAPGNDTEARTMPHHFQKINGSPILPRGPPPGYLQQRNDRQSRYLNDCRLMDPSAAARFAEAIATQDQDPAELAALLSKPSSPNVTENRLYPRPGKSPGDAVKSTVAGAVTEKAQGQTDQTSDNRLHSSAIAPSESASNSTSPRSKHHSRPSSVYSVSSKHLRPHPLIRGQSHGPSGTPPKPAPLAPLTVIPDSASQLSSSAPNDSSLTDRHMPTSPISSLTAPPSPNAPITTQSLFRRSSVSSARSISTLPVMTSVKEARMKPDRHRTLSSISSSSSIAALSSLVHLPVTTSHRISLFPPIDVDVGKILPLLPPPYAENHLQFLAHRSPLRASYNRVMRAKVAAAGGR
ncbi:uncharacterized protein BT62DRAFT_994084 [Guyanagaster necrorhizus]|uniref:Uncharacterized protein n=1 Tax=Guyanagaster necrorhizus TaxID=856835 RepID=A0A9P7VTT0_9AGAR|nr:uncharacterized protein BT62DRAFT_994084 [Guyanagaster necrorhizus MCA 3950]KAG7446483.1 hypothetical protein BT62DRAFT_994084 [Guyanagaster necrorhizus MCA 3950]